MSERDKLKKDASRGDYSAGDFTDWDNPEDADDYENEPEGYYDEGDDDDDGYIPGPDDPDYDLSEAAGYAEWDAPKRRGIIPQWAIALISIVLILSIVIPLLFRP